MSDQDSTIQVFPGDIVQTADGMLLLVSETFGWGVGAVMRWIDRGDERETYHRLKPGQFVKVGEAHLLPEAVAQARRDAVRTAREIARDQ